MLNASAIQIAPAKETGMMSQTRAMSKAAMMIEISKSMSNSMIAWNFSATIGLYSVMWLKAGQHRCHRRVIQYNIPLFHWGDERHLTYMSIQRNANHSRRKITTSRLEYPFAWKAFNHLPGRDKKIPYHDIFHWGAGNMGLPHYSTGVSGTEGKETPASLKRRGSLGWCYLFRFRFNTITALWIPQSFQN